MPSNKNALLRYKILDKLFRLAANKNNFRGFTLKELKGEIRESLSYDISEESIKKDIQFLRNEGKLPITKRTGFYKYEDSSCSFFYPPLNERHLRALEFAGSMLKRYKNAEIFKDVCEAIDIINKSYHRDSENNTQNVDFEQRIIDRGIKHVLTINDAIRDLKQIRFTYFKLYSKEGTIRTLNPLLLKESSEMWYVIGREPGKKIDRVFALDRIQELEILEQDSTYGTPLPVDYFNNVFGISIPEKQALPEEIILSFKSSDAEIVKTKPIHPTQQVIYDDGSEIRVKIMVYYEKEISIELKRELLKWGDSVEIIHPERLRKDLVKAWKAAIKKNESFSKPGKENN